MSRTPSSPLVAQLAAVALVILVNASCAHTRTADPVVDQQRAVEESLLPPVVVEGDLLPAYTIHERMEHYRVPGVSVAVINNGRVEWAMGYGVRRTGSADSVTASTLFQAASISKPVAAAAILRLTEERRLELDAAVNSQLRSWHVPENVYTSQRPVTLRDILTHTSGLTISGFPGYKPGQPVPTAIGILDGNGNTGPVRADTIPGALFRYSGGGYTVAQVLVEDVAGTSFSAVMEETVLRPLGMNRSTYVQPLPEPLSYDAAVGYRADGSPVEGRWHTYPELAAAGLWATPTDLARFALGISAAYNGYPGAILEVATAREMLAEHVEGRGLGFAVAGTGEGRHFSHGGSNAGYQSYLVHYPILGRGVAVMTNSDSGYNLLMEVVRAVSRVYGWPDYQPEVRSTVRVDPSSLAAYAGVYELVSTYTLTVTLEDGQLFGQGTGEPKVRLLAESPTQFFPEGSAIRLTFIRGSTGGASGLVLHLGGRDVEAKRRVP